eukprot:1923783-Prymnesium_polylepis.3
MQYNYTPLSAKSRDDARNNSGKKGRPQAIPTRYFRVGALGLIPRDRNGTQASGGVTPPCHHVCVCHTAAAKRSRS